MQQNLKHFTSPSFWGCYNKLPTTIQELADKNFVILKSDAQYPSLHLKKVGRYWSVGRKYRTLTVETEKRLIWFWIGAHPEYEKLIN